MCHVISSTDYVHSNHPPETYSITKMKTKSSQHRKGNFLKIEEGNSYTNNIERPVSVVSEASRESLQRIRMNVVKPAGRPL